VVNEDKYVDDLSEVGSIKQKVCKNISIKI